MQMLSPFRRAVFITTTCLGAAINIAPAHAGVLKDHQGYWLGELPSPNGPPLKLGLELLTRADGSVWISYASPDQGIYDIPVETIKESGNTLALKVSSVSINMTWAEDHFNAEFMQNGRSVPTELKQVAAFPKKSRPQTPVPPFPYRDETLAIPSADGVVLGATLSIPNGAARPNAVILVAGSGPQTRDAEHDGHRTLAVMADYLARQGIAVLRYDKRGIAHSSGDYWQHTQPQLADDLHAAVEALKSRHQFKRIGIIGHSEGSQIAAMLAAQHPESADFLVSLAGVGLPGVDMQLLQDRYTVYDLRASPQEWERMQPYLRRFYTTIVAQADIDQRITTLKALYNDLSAEDKALIKKYEMDQGTSSFDWAAQPWLRVVLMADAQRDWQAVRCPVLALNGRLDHQVPPENLDGIVAALKSGGNRKVESAVLPSLNHGFQTAKTGAENEYAAIDETIAAIALEKIAAFAIRQ